MPPWHIARGSVKDSLEARAFAPHLTPCFVSCGKQICSTQHAVPAVLLGVFSQLEICSFCFLRGGLDPRSLATNNIALGRW